MKLRHGSRLQHPPAAQDGPEIATQSKDVRHFLNHQAAVVVKKLKQRNQKLYIHAATRGKNFENAKNLLVTPLGGEVLETKVEKVN